jgi:hypothetical protein
MNRILRSESRQCMFPNTSEWTNPFISKRCTQPQAHTAAPAPLTIEDLRVILHARFSNPKVASGWSFMQGWINLQFKYICFFEAPHRTSLTPLFTAQDTGSPRDLPLGNNCIRHNCVHLSEKRCCTRTRLILSTNSLHNMGPQHSHPTGAMQL